MLRQGVPGECLNGRDHGVITPVSDGPAISSKLDLHITIALILEARREYA